MSKRAVWSWQDVKPLVAPTHRVVLVIDDATYRALCRVAEHAGEGIAACAASMLRDVLEDDAAAHGEGQL